MSCKMEFQDKVVLITGGTSGIGEACARRFAREGATVIVAGRNIERGTAITDSIRKDGGKGEFLELDVTNEHSVLCVAEHVQEHFGHLDVLVNNAGIYPRFDPLQEIKQADWDTVFSTNVTGLIMVTKYMLSLLEQANGTIVNIASVAGLQDYASGQGYAYAASKSSVIKITKMMGKIYAGRVRINCVCPGVIDTPLYFALDRKKMSEKIPLGYVGLPEDVANTVRFLASEETRYICGASIVVDGGLTL